MIVHISSPTSFHVLDLARQMARLGHLGRYYTALPRWRTAGLAENKVCRRPLLLGPVFVARQLGSTRMREILDRPTLLAFDCWLSNHLVPCDVFHCLSHMGLAARRTAKRRYGALSVCDRGSSHVLETASILRAEYDRWGLPGHPINPWIIERELADYEEADLITVPSTFVWESFLKHGVPARKLALLPYGVDLSRFHPSPERDESIQVLFVGRVSVRKGVPYLLEAMRRVDRPDITLTLIGEIEDTLRPMVRTDEPRVTHVGPKSGDDLRQAFSRAAMLVLPSVEEGLALVMAQAMACGTPVIATSSTGATDLFTNGKEGFIVPPRNSEALAEKITLLANQPDLRREMSCAALERVRRIGGWDQYGNRAAQAYARAIEDKARAAIDLEPCRVQP